MFNVRVYGILINEKKQILLSNELIRGKHYTKFPGGGLQIGEGTRDCLRREFLEEMNLEVEVLEHIYTTDFYQQSAFNPDDQIISIYYAVKPAKKNAGSATGIENDFSKDDVKVMEANSEIESFSFEYLEIFSSKKVSLPIDKVVADIVVKKYHNS